MRSSTENAERFFAMRSHRLARYLKGGNLIEEAARQAKDFRSFVLGHVGEHIPLSGYEIARRVGNDWGSVGERRVYRALARLVADGVLEHGADGYVKRRVA